MSTSTIHEYPQALQAAVDAALAAFPADADRIYRGADLVQRGHVRPPANGKGWLVGVNGWKVDTHCNCHDHVLRGVTRCKHFYAKCLYRKMHATPPPRSLRFYATLREVNGIATVYNTGQVLFEADGAPEPRILSDYEIIVQLVLGWRVDDLVA